MKRLKKILSSFLICMVTIMSLSSVSFAATVGEQLKSPEAGWQRFDDNDSNIIYKGSGWSESSRTAYYGGSRHQSLNTALNDTICFGFKGTKLRLIAAFYPTYSNDLYISIDGVKESFSQVGTYTSPTNCQRIIYENTNLDNTNHIVKIGKNSSGTYTCDLTLDAIDIDDSGELLPPQESNLKVVLGVGESLQLSVNNDLDVNAKMTWSSDDDSIATVDANGIATGVNSGSTVITVTNADGTYKETINLLVINDETDLQLAIDLRVGDTRRLTVDDLTDTVNVTWTSNSQSIATVSDTGKVTAIGVGTTYVTATDDQGNEIGKILVRVRK
jgi:uncharacterized protein YjdB